MTLKTPYDSTLLYFPNLVCNDQKEHRNAIMRPIMLNAESIRSNTPCYLEQMVAPRLDMRLLITNSMESLYNTVALNFTC